MLQPVLSINNQLNHIPGYKEAKDGFVLAFSQNNKIIGKKAVLCGRNRVHWKKKLPGPGLGTLFNFLTLTTFRALSLRTQQGHIRPLTL
jgi:hypothetical protein